MNFDIKVYENDFTCGLDDSRRIYIINEDHRFPLLTFSKIKKIVIDEPGGVFIFWRK